MDVVSTRLRVTKTFGYVFTIISLEVRYRGRFPVLVAI